MCWAEKQVLAHVDVPFLCDWRQNQPLTEHTQLQMVPHQSNINQHPIMVSYFTYQTSTNQQSQ